MVSLLQRLFGNRLEESSSIEVHKGRERYLQPVGEAHNINRLCVLIDRANLPKETVGIGEAGFVTPEVLFARLDSDIRQINGTTVISSSPYEGEVDVFKHSSRYAHYLLNQYSPFVSVYIKKQNFPQGDNYPNGCSEIVITASYVGEPGLRIRELEEIAKEHGLEEGL